jgi:hypothetical protein
LYYPHIHFRNVDWLKMAFLYWESLARIVPSAYVPHDSPAVQELLDAAPSFLVNRPPGESVLKAASEPFMKLLESHGGELREKLRVEHSGGDPVDMNRRPNGRDILGPKLDHELKQSLVDAKLADIGGDQSGLEAVYVHPRLADLYMSVLASEMARASRFHPLTDRPMEHLGMSGVTVDRLAQALELIEQQPITDREVESEMVLFSLRTVMPKGLQGVPFKRLARFRRDHSEELSAYQDFIAEVTGPGGALAGLSEFEDQQDLQAQLDAAYRRTVEPKVKSLREALHGIGLETVHSVATVTVGSLGAISGVGAGATALGAAVAAPFAPIFAVAAIGLGVFSVARRKALQATAAAEESPVAYLMYAEEELTPRGALGRLKTSARRFAIAR